MQGSEAGCRSVPSELPMPKMITNLRTAAMGVLLLHLQIEMGATVWVQFPQLQTLPEDSLACFVAAQFLSPSVSKEGVVACVERVHRLLLIYRQCRHAFHNFAVHVEAVSPGMDGSPAILMALSSERSSTFREMFPGIKDDNIDQYGLAAKLRLPGKHIAMINRCLSNRDANFTEAVERFLGGSFGDAPGLFRGLPLLERRRCARRRSAQNRRAGRRRPRRRVAAHGGGVATA